MKLSLAMFALFALAPLCAQGIAFSEQIDPRNVLETLRKGHPRILLLNEDVDRIRHLCETNALARRMKEKLTREANKMLSEPPVEYKIVGPRLLAQSR